MVGTSSISDWLRASISLKNNDYLQTSRWSNGWLNAGGTAPESYGWGWPIISGDNRLVFSLITWWCRLAFCRCHRHVTTSATMTNRKMIMVPAKIPVWIWALIIPLSRSMVASLEPILLLTLQIYLLSKSSAVASEIVKRADALLSVISVNRVENLPSLDWNIFEDSTEPTISSPKNPLKSTSQKNLILTRYRGVDRLNDLWEC